MKPIAVIVAFSFCLNCFAQQDDETGKHKKHHTNGKGFQTGLFLGSLFANKYTANLYDGYGYDNNGVKNDFLNSFMYQKIIMEYGGGNGQTDQIAQQLNVNPGDWAFDKTDMPINMKYNPSFVIGLQGRWQNSKKTGVLLNINAAKLSLNGNFTIQILTPPIGPVQPNFQNIQIFSIRGAEQRIDIQAGLQRILGEDEIFGVIIEGGPLLNMVKFTSNKIIINNLNIDLMTFYDQYGYQFYKAKNLTGVDFGAFAGIGVNINTNANWKLQAIYNPSYEKIDIGENPKPKLQHALGIRVYYDM